MPSSRILRTLDFGAMMTIAYQLNRVEREAVARFLGKPGGDPMPRPEAFCRDRSVSIDTSASPIWNGWSPSPTNSRFAPAALAKLTPDQVSKLKLKWAFGFEGDISAFSQPTVIGNQVFIGSAGGVVHALRADTGCLQWTFQAAGSIRSAIVAAPLDGRQRLALRRSHRLVLRARRRDGQRDLAQAARGARGRSTERTACRRRRRRIHRGIIVGRVARAESRSTHVAHSEGASRLCAFVTAVSSGRHTRSLARPSGLERRQAASRRGGHPALESGPRRRSISSAAASTSRRVTTTQCPQRRRATR